MTEVEWKIAFFLIFWSQCSFFLVFVAIVIVVAAVILMVVAAAVDVICSLEIFLEWMPSTSVNMDLLMIFWFGR